MPVIEIEQNSEEWKKWRNDHIGASDLPIIMGESKWCTPFQLWQRKLGFMPEQEENYAMRQGKEMEPFIRDLANQQLDGKFEPKVMIHKDLEWASASLDGICPMKKAIMEIKCPSEKDHELAEKDEVPPHYIAQVQWQLFVSNLSTCYYVSYHDSVIAVVKVKRDDAYIKDKLLAKAADFYHSIVHMEEPERTEKDVIQITDEEFGMLALEWKGLDTNMKSLKAKEKKVREQLLSFTDDSNCRGFGITLRRINREGSVDWKKLWEDLSESCQEIVEKFPLDNYRKEQIGYWKISQEKS